MSSASTNPNNPTRTESEAALDQLKRIQARYKEAKSSGKMGATYNGAEFEKDVKTCLNLWFPYSVLSGVRLFTPSMRKTGAFAYEIDNLFHVREAGTDYLIVVESKLGEIAVEGKEWRVTYGAKNKCARQQVENHIISLYEYLKPIAHNTTLKIIAIVTSPHESTKEKKITGYRNSKLILCSLERLAAVLGERFEFDASKEGPHAELLSVSQSPFLSLLRLSLANPALGHPEYGSAIRYIDRCRRLLDQTLFEDFSPKQERWLINGSAGMGKSVLLAYTAAVFSSGRELVHGGSVVDLGLQEATEKFDEINFNVSSGRVAMVAMSARQLEGLEEWYDAFVEKYQSVESFKGDLHFRRPVFMLARDIKKWKDRAPEDAFSAVLVDEAHDLSAPAANDLKELHGVSPFYLVAACDRHQQLQLVGTNARVIKGFDFTNRWTRLKHVYRNPASVYIASLGLLFRWFADKGPKIIPTDQQLKESFGFDVLMTNSNGRTLHVKNDAHPANCWAHSVAEFPTAEVAAEALRAERLSRDEVLWVRFSEEDSDFDYESLHHEFTYHNFRSKEASDLCDKYVKGQDFPVVVIEGFPGFMDLFDEKKDEEKMWQFRRELYLCASRATSFLFFVCNVKETPEVGRIRTELTRLLLAAGRPRGTAEDTGSRSWAFTITPPTVYRKLEDFPDTQEDQEHRDPKDLRKVKSGSSQESGEVGREEESSKLKQSISTAREEEAQSQEGLLYPLHNFQAMSAREFAKLVEFPVSKVSNALIDQGQFEGENAEVSREILAEIAPLFGCMDAAVMGDDAGDSAEAPEESDDTELVKPNQDAVEGEQAVGDQQDSQSIEWNYCAIHPGSWIEDRNLGFGLVRRLRTDPENPGADVHEVWFSTGVQLRHSISRNVNTQSVVGEDEVPPKYRKQEARQRGEAS